MAYHVIGDAWEKNRQFENHSISSDIFENGTEDFKFIFKRPGMYQAYIVNRSVVEKHAVKRYKIIKDKDGNFVKNQAFYLIPDHFIRKYGR